MKQKLVYTPESITTIRVDKLLSKTFPEYSRSALAKLFDLKLIKINGEPIQPGFKVRPGAEIEYDITPLQQKPEVIELPILYEDDEIIVIDKPAGIISHARGRFWQEASVASFIRNKVSKKLDSERGGIVHRLDRVTSGVMVCAKNEAVLSELQKAFSDRKVVKKYLALVNNRPKEDAFIIDAPIARDPRTPKKFIVDPSGKPAETQVEVLHSSDKRSLLLLTPKTGRTHQLRVHLQYVGNPIIGDPLYGSEAYRFSEHSNDLRLHAVMLSIPLHKKMRTFVSNVPKYWKLTSDEHRSIETKQLI